VSSSTLFDSGGGTVLGLDNVALDLPVARVGSRVLAALLDYVVLAGFLGVWAIAGFALATALTLGGWGIALLFFGAFVLEHGYFVIQEIAFGGQTLGKRALSIRVVTGEGTTPAAGLLAVRNLLRFLDLVVGVPMIGTDRRARRLGDRLAGTLVVHYRPQDRELVLGRIPDGWEIQETQIVEAYLRRAGELEVAQRLSVGRRVERLVDQRAPGFLPPDGAGEPFERLAAGFALELQ